MLSFLRWLQSWHAPWWDRAMVAYSDLYGKPVFILVLLSYWWWPREQSRWLVTLVCGNQWFNSVLKFLVNTPRPAGEGLRHLSANSGTGPAFPSGHTEGMTVALGAVALMRQRRWLWALAVIGVLLMAYSRMYTGYHWPVDVAGGAGIGAVLLALWYVGKGKYVTDSALRARPGATRQNPWPWIAGALLLPALLALAVHPYGLVPSPDDDSTKNAVTVLGLLAGFLAGSFGEERWVGFDSRAGSRGWHWLKLPVGAVIVAVFFFGGELLLHGEGVPRYARYTMDGLAVSFLAPWIFTRLRRSTAERT